MTTLRLSCVVPARNESGHLKDVLEKVCSVNAIEDIVIIEGGSSDDTWEIAQGIASTQPDRIRAIKQTGKGKFDAVLAGANVCRFNLVLIWDADGTVPLDDTKKVIDRSLSTGNPSMGDRLRGKIEPGAMQPANWIGNWVFAILWSPLLRDRPRDMLCGTKIFPREIFVSMPAWLRNLDPYGDFALVAYAKSCKFRVESEVVAYQARTYGSTNIHRWSGGFKLLRTTFRVYWWALCGFRKKTLGAE